MSQDKSSEPAAENNEINDEDLESVAGGSVSLPPWITPTFPTEPDILLVS